MNICLNDIRTRNQTTPPHKQTSENTANPVNFQPNQDADQQSLISTSGVDSGEPYPEYKLRTFKEWTELCARRELLLQDVPDGFAPSKKTVAEWYQILKRRHVLFKEQVLIGQLWRFRESMTELLAADAASMLSYILPLLRQLYFEISKLCNQTGSPWIKLAEDAIRPKPEIRHVKIQAHPYKTSEKMTQEVASTSSQYGPGSFFKPTGEVFGFKPQTRTPLRYPDPFGLDDVEEEPDEDFVPAPTDSDENSEFNEEPFATLPPPIFEQELSIQQSRSSMHSFTNTEMVVMVNKCVGETASIREKESFKTSVGSVHSSPSKPEMISRSSGPDVSEDVLQETVLCAGCNAKVMRKTSKGIRLRGPATSPIRRIFSSATSFDTYNSDASDHSRTSFIDNINLESSDFSVQCEIIVECGCKSCCSLCALEFKDRAVQTDRLMVNKDIQCETKVRSIQVQVGSDYKSQGVQVGEPTKNIGTQYDLFYLPPEILQVLMPPVKTGPPMRSQVSQAVSPSLQTIEKNVPEVVMPKKLTNVVTEKRTRYPSIQAKAQEETQTTGTSITKISSAKTQAETGKGPEVKAAPSSPFTVIENKPEVVKKLSATGNVPKILTSLGTETTLSVPNLPQSARPSVVQSQINPNVPQLQRPPLAPQINVPPQGIRMSMVSQLVQPRPNVPGLQPTGVLPPSGQGLQASSVPPAMQLQPRSYMPAPSQQPRPNIPVTDLRPPMISASPTSAFRPILDRSSTPLNIPIPPPIDREKSIYPPLPSSRTKIKTGSISSVTSSGSTIFSKSSTSLQQAKSETSKPPVQSQQSLLSVRPEVQLSVQAQTIRDNTSANVRPVMNVRTLVRPVLQPQVRPVIPNAVPPVQAPITPLVPIVRPLPLPEPLRTERPVSPFSEIQFTHVDLGYNSDSGGSSALSSTSPRSDASSKEEDSPRPPVRTDEGTSVRTQEAAKPPRAGTEEKVNQTIPIQKATMGAQTVPRRTPQIPAQGAITPSVPPPNVEQTLRSSQIPPTSSMPPPKSPMAGVILSTLPPAAQPQIGSQILPRGENTPPMYPPTSQTLRSSQMMTPRGAITPQMSPPSSQTLGSSQITPRGAVTPQMSPPTSQNLGSSQITPRAAVTPQMSPPTSQSPGSSQIIPRGAITPQMSPPTSQSPGSSQIIPRGAIPPQIPQPPAVQPQRIVQTSPRGAVTSQMPPTLESSQTPPRGAITPQIPQNQESSQIYPQLPQTQGSPQIYPQTQGSPQITSRGAITPQMPPPTVQMLGPSSQIAQKQAVTPQIPPAFARKPIEISQPNKRKCQHCLDMEEMEEEEDGYALDSTCTCSVSLSSGTSNSYLESLFDNSPASNASQRRNPNVTVLQRPSRTKRPSSMPSSMHSVFEEEESEEPGGS